MFFQSMHIAGMFTFKVDIEKNTVPKDILEKIIQHIKQKDRGLQKLLSNNFTFEDMARQAYRLALINKLYTAGGEDTQSEMMGLALNEFEKLGILSEETRPFVHSLYLPNCSSCYRKEPFELPVFSVPKLVCMIIRPYKNF